MASALVPNFNFGGSYECDGDTTDGSALDMTSGANSIKLDSEAHSVRSWESESERSWENESDDDDDDALGALDAWMNDEEYVPTKENKQQTSENQAWQMSGRISNRLQEEFKNIMKNESAKERARKASREIIRERNDTSGGGKRSIKREHIIIKWMLRITHLNKESNIDFADWIQDGTVLTLIMTTLDFNSVERLKYKCGSNPAKERVESVRTAILNYGVDPKYLFTTEAVINKSNTPKVVRCLEEVAKLSRQETHIVLDTLRKDKLYT